MGWKIHLTRFLVLRTIHGALVVEVAMEYLCTGCGGGVSCIASGGFSLENSRTKNSRRECRLSVPGFFRVYACPGGCVGGCVPICVCVYPCACVCVECLCRHSGEKAKASHKNGLNSGLYSLIGIRLPKQTINPIKRPKFKPYGRVRFLSVSQRAQRERK